MTTPTLEQIAEKYFPYDKFSSIRPNRAACIAALTEAVQPLQREIEEVRKWKDEDPRMLREQIRVADSAYQQLQHRLDEAEKDKARLEHLLGVLGQSRSDVDGTMERTT